MTIKILNLYSGLGGNRKLWSGDIEVTAIENVPEIAKIYQDFFPNDKVIVCDAHQYLLEHYKEFDFIWSSPPCPTHSLLRKGLSMNAGAKAVYPNMKLYEEVLFLQGYFKGKWVVENVISWYNPLIRPYEIGRHYYWANFPIAKRKVDEAKFSITGGINSETDKMQIKRMENELGFDLSKYDDVKRLKRLLLRNCVEPKTGLHVFNMAFKDKQKVLEI